MYPPEPELLEEPEVDPLAELDGIGELSDRLGNAIKVNADRSAGVDNPAAARDYAKAALDLTQALTALVPYVDPNAPNPKGDNPAKDGD